ncbi:MAG: hypothetical protein LBE60_11125 [Microbacterium sp.]|jgi:peptidoglycan hydrolase-like protein with peptidoglycan-binding domain|uniref:peptidoglycan-binding domain-containing protein n=1 Tax=Microbacterium sp. TaxID=51671 RepID=UPI00281C57D8|nr:hypothetical protein [Microbacterium sp.]MDR2322185.1 hypothetical protein [Microbacterium sp.]
MTVVLLVCVLALVGGVLAGSLLFPRTLPPSAGQEAAGTRTVPVALKDYDDQRQVKAKATWADGAQVLAGDTGMVTTVDCTAGEVWAAGTAPISINDRPRVAIHTSRPLWRDLQGGEEGPDVEALQSFLDAQGYSTSDSGRYDWSTSTSWRQFLRDRGVATDSTAFALSGVVVLPADKITIQTCPAVGAAVTPGAALATQVPTLTAVLVSMPASLAPGERTVTIGAASAVVDESGKVADPSAFVAEPAVVQARSAGAGKEEIDASVKLTTPLKVGMVPPSALFAISSKKGCVANGKDTIPVTIVASSLGLTAVTFGTGKTPAKVDAKPGEGRTCG